MEGFLAMLTSLFLVLLLLLALLAAIKKFGSVHGSSSNRMIHIRDSLSMGPRQKVVLVSVRDREVLLGVSAQEIRVLSEWPNLSEECEANEANSKIGFREGLTALLTNKS